MTSTTSGVQERRSTPWHQRLLKRWHKRLSISLVACLATLFSVVAQPIGNVTSAGAQLHVADGAVVANPGCDDPPGSCNVNPDNGCPTAGPVTAPSDQHCVPIPVQLVIEPMTVGPVGHTVCAGNYYVQVQLLPTLSDYEAVWWSDIGLGTRWWSAPGTTSPGTVLGIGYRYSVPEGYAAWSAAYGDCGGTPGTFGVSAWGVTDRWEVSGQITYSNTNKPAVGVSVTANCPSGYTTSTNDNGFYEFLLQRGPCTIVPTPPDGLSVDPEKQALDVEGNIDNVDFQIEATLYFAVTTGLSVKSNSSTGAGLIKAGTSFTERVELKDISKTKSVLVAPIYPTISGNAEGGALQAPGGTVQRQLSSSSPVPVSPIVVLHPGQEQDFDSVITTVASRQLGTFNALTDATGGTRAYVQFAVPNAFVLHDDDSITPLDPRQVVVAQGSTDKLTVSIDDSAPDQTSTNGFRTTADISAGLWQAFLHVTAGVYNQIYSALIWTPTDAQRQEVASAAIHFVQLESQLWQEAKHDPAEMLALTNVTYNAIQIIYKQAPFLLAKISDLRAQVNQAVYNHFNAIEEDSVTGNWDKAVTEWSQDAGEFIANAALTLYTPKVMAPAIADADIGRAPQLLGDLEGTETAEFQTASEKADEAIGTGQDESAVENFPRTMAEIKPGMPGNLWQAENIMGMSGNEALAISKETYANKIKVLVRSRAVEAIKLVQEGVADVKPAVVQLKTTNPVYQNFFDYPTEIETAYGKTVPSNGIVLIREPVYLSATCDQACAIAQLKQFMLSKSVEEGSSEWATILQSWNDTYTGWTSHAEGFVPELEKAAQEGQITLKMHLGENQLDPALFPEPQTVGFRLRDLGGGTRIPEMCQPWVVATKVCTGQWKAITGDLDLAAIVRADNTGMSDEEMAGVITRLSQGAAKTQHPSTITWYKQLDDETWVFDAKDLTNFPQKSRYMMADKCCLLEFGPDGQMRWVQIDLQGSRFVNKNDFYLNIIGGSMDPSPGPPPAWWSQVPGAASPGTGLADKAIAPDRAGLGSGKVKSLAGVHFYLNRAHDLVPA